MSTLIIGGAFVVALLALIGLVFVIRAEPSANTAGAKAVPQEKPTPAPAVAVPVAAPQEGVSQQPVTVRRTAPVTQKLPLHLEAEIPAIQEEKEFPISNEQWHELSAQLSTLHEQAQEFEHRLNVLAEMIRHIEHAQHGYVNVEDEEEVYTASR